jgi:hypothetical protein
VELEEEEDVEEEVEEEEEEEELIGLAWSFFIPKICRKISVNEITAKGLKCLLSSAMKILCTFAAARRAIT